MFRASSEFPLLSAASIYGLRVSLNAPVVANDEIEGAPARAAILLHDEGYGSISLGVALRPVAGGACIFYGYQSQLLEDPVEAMETGLGFAEELGFLFDDDLIADDTSASHSAALQRWTEFVGDAAAVAPETVATTELELELEVEVEPDEVLLEDTAAVCDPGASHQEVQTARFAGRGDGIDLEPMEEPTPPRKPAPPPEPEIKRQRPEAAELFERRGPSARRDASDRRDPDGRREQDAAAQPGLSKFRGGQKTAEALETGPTASQSGAALGRIPLVRRRKRAPNAADKGSALLRLLSNF